MGPLLTAGGPDTIRLILWCHFMSHDIQNGPVDVWVLQVETLTGVIPQDEREHRVLHEVVEGAARVLVEVREVLEVRDLSRAPQLRQRRDVSVFQQVGQIGSQDVVVDVVPELEREGREAGVMCKSE